MALHGLCLAMCVSMSLDWLVDSRRVLHLAVLVTESLPHWGREAGPPVTKTSCLQTSALQKKGLEHEQLFPKVAVGWVMVPASCSAPISRGS